MKSHKVIYEIIDFININESDVIKITANPGIDEFLTSFRITSGKNNPSKICDLRFFIDRVYIDPIGPSYSLSYRYSPLVLDLINLLVERNKITEPNNDRNINSEKQTIQNIVLRLI